MKHRRDDLLTVVLVVCAVLVTAAVVKREFFGGPSVPPEDAPRRVSDWESLSAAGIRRGAEDAPVVIVEFADFQCPFCAVESRNLHEVLMRHGDQVAFVFRHFPLSAIHPHAYSAAVAAECASAQGGFEAFHDLLFERQAEIGSVEWAEFAAMAAVPSVADFSVCMDEEWPRERVNQDIDAAMAAGLTSTPSVIVNGWLLPGTPSVAMLEERICRELDSC